VVFVSSVALKNGKGAREARGIELENGEKASFNGKEFEVLRLPNPYLSCIRDNPCLSPKEKEAYTKVVEELLPVRALADRIAAGQFASGHMEAIEWLGDAAKAIPAAGNEKLVGGLRAFHAFTRKHLTLFDDDEGIKSIPPFTMKELRAAIESVPDPGERSRLLEGFEKHAQTVFSVEHVPPGMNLYRFRTPDDRKRFLESLGPEFGEMQSALESAVKEYRAMPDAGTAKISEISRRMGKAEADALRARLEKSAAEGIADPNTIVRMSVTKSGKLLPEAVRYEDEFHKELMGVFACFIQASREARAVSPKLAEQLEAIGEAAITGDYARADDASYRMTGRDSLLDVAFEYQETYIDGVLGKKGEYAFRVSIADSREDKVLETIGMDPRFKSLNIARLNTFIVGGHSSRRAVSGQKLPNADDARIYKTMVFGNVSELIQTKRLEPIAPLMDLHGSDFQLMIASAVPSVGWHEAAHVLGNQHSGHLSSLGNPVEECSAETHSALLAEQMAPEHLRGVILRLAAYGPARITMGVSGAHAKADLCIVGRMMEDGALGFDQQGRMRVDAALGLESVKKLAREVEILEGPEKNRGDAEKLLAPELARLAEKGEKEDLGKAAFMRAEAMFGDDAIARVAKKLEPVSKKLEGEPVPVVFFGYLDDPLQKAE
jgi:hypothetical protein